MSIRLSGLIVAATLMGRVGRLPRVTGRLPRSGPHLAGRRRGYRDLQPALRGHFGHRLRRYGGPTEAERVRSRLAARPTPDELHADHELGCRNHGRGVRP